MPEKFEKEHLGNLLSEKFGTFWIKKIR